MPSTGYDADDHAGAVAATLDDLGITEPVVVVGHSLGALVALRLAARHPRRVKAVVTFGPPLFRDKAEARRRVARLDAMSGLLAFDTPIAQRVCVAVRGSGSFSVPLVRLVRPELPLPIAEDALRHTWASYSETMSHVILSRSGDAWLREVRLPVTLVLGTEDHVSDARYLTKLAERYHNVRFVRVAGHGHDVPITAPSISLGEVTKALTLAAPQVSVPGHARGVAEEQPRKAPPAR